jgi:predicted Zn-ribbon and HTH transcriptional regulator
MVAFPATETAAAYVSWRGRVVAMSLMGAADNERAHADRLAPGSVISVLLEQHAKIRNTFAAVQLAKGERRRELFDELRELLAVHEAGEEIVLRPASRKSAGDQVVDARNSEEAEAARVLAAMETMDVAGEQFAGTLAELEKAVFAHADREEFEEFAAVQGAYSDEELQSMGEKLLKAQSKAPTHPHPAAAGSPTAQRVVGPFAALLDKARDAHND